MDRRFAAAACALVMSACATDVLVEDGTNPVVVTALDRTFDDAAHESGVPSDLLKAIGYVETRWEMVTAAEEMDGMPPGAGVMALRPASIARGAALAGVSADEVTGDAEANIRAAALLIGEEARLQGISGADLA